MEDGFRNIKDQYKIKQTLGRGSNSTVKLAKKRSTGELFAVKVLSKRKMTVEQIGMLMSEIYILKQIDHPNIVKLIDIFEDECHWCLVMERMQGGELQQRIDNGKTVTEEEAREVI